MVRLGTDVMWILVLSSVFAGLAFWGYKAETSNTGPDETPEIQNTPDAPLLNEIGDYAVINPSERSTWPTGDKVWDFCQAIAIAEGYEQPNSNPAKLCNPGDISDGADTFGYEAHSGSKVTHFPDHETGWKWLYKKVSNALDGRSHVYTPDMTFIQFAQKYAGLWQNWYKNVTNDLGVDPNTTVGDWYNG